MQLQAKTSNDLAKDHAAPKYLHRKRRHGQLKNRQQTQHRPACEPRRANQVEIDEGQTTHRCSVAGNGGIKSVAWGVLLLCELNGCCCTSQSDGPTPSEEPPRTAQIRESTEQPLAGNHGEVYQDAENIKSSNR